MIDLSATKVIIFTYPDAQLSSRIWSWCLEMKVPNGNITFAFDSPLVVARNKAVVSHCRGGKFEHYLFIDKDMEPKAKTIEPMLETELDACCAVSNSGEHKMWANPRAFHCGMFVVRREVFEAVEGPWFMLEYDRLGTKLKGCECMYFRDKVLEAGFTVGHAGWCDHFSERQNSWHKGA